MSVKDFIDKTKKEIKANSNEIDRLEKLTSIYNDLEQSYLTRNNIVYCSKQVNAQAKNFEWRRTCGCCGDAGVMVCPYIDTDLGRVYSDPSHFVVGNQEPWTHDSLANIGWQDYLRKYNISEEIIERVAHHFTREKTQEEMNFYR